MGKLIFIFFKLQTPASFAQSVQELTIALQRTGDPANLNRLRPHLELLANIDPSPGKPKGDWWTLLCVRPCLSVFFKSFFVASSWHFPEWIFQISSAVLKFLVPGLPVCTFITSTNVCSVPFTVPLTPPAQESSRILCVPLTARSCWILLFSSLLTKLEFSHCF